MKKLMLLAALALALPMGAFADSQIDFQNSGGTLAGSSSGLTLSGSTLTSVNGLNGGGLITGSLGSVSLMTGGLISGALNGKNAPITVGGVTMIPPSVFSGGSLTITGNGSNGLTAYCSRGLSQETYCGS
ncbi:MAG: hypothetical protein M3O09_12865 [Acidobacteriota bacterium]|nr:hypothetical protein [Acidobacteriota bacterium]